MLRSGSPTGAHVHTILILDDHAAVRAAVRELFGSALRSTIFTEAENGAEALIRASQDKPDLIVLDLAMPVMNGFETAKALRLLFPRIPVVMLTAHYLEGTKTTAQKLGIRGVFCKLQDLTPLLAHARALLASA
jgi:two-component system response regulator EvgA